jgi:glycosyltransferase involved in cell wall biosynthesis
MKIVFSSNISWSIYNFRTLLLKSLQKDGHIIYTVASKDKYADKLIDEGFFFDEVKLNNNSKNPFEDIKLVFQYYKLYKKIKPDLILHNSIKPNIYGSLAARFLGIKVINNISGLASSYILNNWITKVTLVLYKISQLKAQVVFFQNPVDLKIFTSKRIIKTNIARYIPGSGVDLDDFKFLKRINNIKRPFKFIFVGRLIKDKGVIELYNATMNLKKVHKNFIVKIVGDRYDGNNSNISVNDYLKFQKDPIFEMVSHTDNIYEQLIHSDCLILPSYREGLSKSLIEAGSSGLPAITSDVPGCNDIIIDGYNGFLVNSRDFISLKNKMEKVLLLDKETLYEMGINSRKIVEENFSINEVNRIYKKEINKILVK